MDSEQQHKAELPLADRNALAHTARESINSSALSASIASQSPFALYSFFLPFPKRLVFSDNPFFGGGENEDDEEIEAGY